MTTIASIAHLEHVAQLKVSATRLKSLSTTNVLELLVTLQAVASDFKHEFHQQNNTLPGSAVPKGSAPHLADQAFSQYVDAVSKETGLSKQAIMSVRESGIPRGAIDAKSVEGLIDQDARERSAWESQTRMLLFPSSSIFVELRTHCQVLACCSGWTCEGRRCGGDAECCCEASCCH
jgi:hypothetical protein